MFTDKPTRRRLMETFGIRCDSPRKDFRFLEILKQIRSLRAVCAGWQTGIAVPEKLKSWNAENLFPLGRWQAWRPERSGAPLSDRLQPVTPQKRSLRKRRDFKKG